MDEHHCRHSIESELNRFQMESDSFGAAFLAPFSLRFKLGDPFILRGVRKYIIRILTIFLSIDRPPTMVATRSNSALLYRLFQRYLWRPIKISLRPRQPVRRQRRMLRS